jgi:hypothetical protein
MGCGRMGGRAAANGAGAGRRLPFFLFTIIFYIFALPLRGDSRSRVVTLLQTYARARRVGYMGIVEDTNMDRNNRRRTLGKNGGEGDPNEGECVGVGIFFLDDQRYINPQNPQHSLTLKKNKIKKKKMSKLNKIWRFKRR